jgi:hypothetical protein
MKLRAVALPFALFGFVLASCGGGSHSSAPGDAGVTGDDASIDDASTLDASTGDATPSGDAAPDAGGLDGTPTRQACTGAFGSALTTSFGRLDGYLVAIVPAGHRGCNGDSTHVHLQVRAQSAVYDVAVNVDGLFHQQDLARPGAAWSEGWHTGVTDSYASLGVHSSQFAASTVAQLGPEIEMLLANANHVSIYATGYGPTGVHLVHYQGRGNDGMVVLDPLSPTSHALMFAFQGDTF